MEAMAGDEKPVLHFVLVHGFTSGAWASYGLRCLMESTGYRVSCIDLAGCGIDRTDVKTIRTFDQYNEPLLYFMSALPDDEQIILVGHSAGGLSVTQASHKFPKKIRMAVYVAATMLKLGFQTGEDKRIGIPPLEPCHSDPPSEYGSLEKMLSRDGPFEAIASARFVQESSEFERVERIYIRTMRDHILKPWQQTCMIKLWPPSRVYDLDTDHGPPPIPLFQLLIKATT